MNEQPFYFILFCPLQARYDEYWLLFATVRVLNIVNSCSRKNN
jgi:hypothetical protein